MTQLANLGIGTRGGLGEVFLKRQLEFTGLAGQRRCR